MVMAKLRGSRGLPLKPLFHVKASALGLAGGAVLVMAKLLGSQGLPLLLRRVRGTSPCATSRACG